MRVTPAVGLSFSLQLDPPAALEQQHQRVQTTGVAPSALAKVIVATIVYGTHVTRFWVFSGLLRKGGFFYTCLRGVCSEKFVVEPSKKKQG